MKKIIFHLVIILTFFSHMLYGQPGDPGLQIGDKVPDISIGRLLNEPNRKMKISDFKGKLLILDFWGVHCGVCIANMPKVDSLQKQFAGKVQFVYVTRDSEKQVNDLFQKRGIKHRGIPFIVNDKKLDKLFPHTGNPLHVWITPNGTVHAITQHYNTNALSITAFLRGENIQLPRRWDWGYNRNFSILSEQNSALLGFVDSYSLWLNGDLSNTYTNGSIQVLKDNSSNHVTGLRMFNRTVFDLFGFAYSPEIFQVPVNYQSLFKNNRVIFELKDSSVINFPKEYSKVETWRKENQYTYELKLPARTNKTIYDVLKQDLSLKFPYYNVAIENRRVNCIVLSDLLGADQDKARSKDSSAEPNVLYNSDSGITVQNLPVNSFLEHLIYVYSYYKSPFVSETNFKGNLQMQLHANPMSIEQLNKELNRYGFQIRLEEREIKMLLVKDKENKIAAH